MCRRIRVGLKDILLLSCFASCSCTEPAIEHSRHFRDRLDRADLQMGVMYFLQTDKSVHQYKFSPFQSFHMFMQPKPPEPSHLRLEKPIECAFPDLCTRTLFPPRNFTFKFDKHVSCTRQKSGGKVFFVGLCRRNLQSEQPYLDAKTIGLCVNFAFSFSVL